ncbi:MAG: YcxB family protein [Planctomycetota bacterium]
MSLPIEIGFVWDEEHYARSIRAYLSGRRQRLITALFLLFAAYLVYAAIVVFRHAWPMAALYIAMAAMLLILRGPWKRIWIRRRFRSRPDRNKSVRYVFSEQGIRAETDGLAKSEIDWTMPVETLVSRDTLLIFLTPRQYLYVPLGDQREELLELVRSKIACDS